MEKLTQSTYKDYLKGHTLVMIDHNQSRYILRCDPYPFNEWTWHQLGPYAIWTDALPKEQAVVKCLDDARCSIYAIEFKDWTRRLESIIPIEV